jgi:hypothetical protein
MGQPEAELELEEEYFKIGSGISESKIMWSHILKVQQTRNAWILYFSETETMTLPLASLPTDAKDFIRSKFRNNNIGFI